MNPFDRAGIEAALRRRLYPEDELQARIEQLEAAGQALVDALDERWMGGAPVMPEFDKFRAVLDSEPQR